MSPATAIMEAIERGSPQARSILAKRAGEAGLIFLLCVSVVAPNVVLSPALPYFRTETILLFAVLLIYVWFLLAGFAKPIRLNAIYWIGVLFSLATAISIFYGTSILNHELTYR